MSDTENDTGLEITDGEGTRPATEEEKATLVKEVEEELEKKEDVEISGEAATVPEGGGGSVTIEGDVTVKDGVVTVEKERGDTVEGSFPVEDGTGTVENDKEPDAERESVINEKLDELDELIDEIWDSIEINVGTKADPRWIPLKVEAVLEPGVFCGTVTIEDPPATLPGGFTVLEEGVWRVGACRKGTVTGAWRSTK